jgi:hypothetical protein
MADSADEEAGLLSEEETAVAGRAVPPGGRAAATPYDAVRIYLKARGFNQVWLTKVRLPAAKRVWKATSKADPRQKQDWILKCLQGGRAHPLAARGVANRLVAALDMLPRLLELRGGTQASVLRAVMTPCAP